MTTELTTVAAHVQQAADYLGVFGWCDGDATAQTKHVKRVYRKLAQVLHPDNYTSPDAQAAAAAGFTRLGEFLSQAEEAIQEGVYGQARAIATVQTKKAKHAIYRHMMSGDISDIYWAETTAGSVTAATVCKVAMSQTDTDLLQVEAKVLKRLRAAGTNEKAHPYVPELIDNFMYQEPGQHTRAANVMNRLGGFYTFEQVKQAYPYGLNPLDLAWMWRRLLVALDHAHRNEVVHGAVLPAHVMILPDQHGLVLVDWCYASIGDDSGWQPLTAIVDRYQSWYPQEVLKKHSPGPATDIAMAARCMVYLLGGDPETGNMPAHRVPRQFRAFFKGCLQTRQTSRPNDAWVLIQEFDELLESMGSPYYPRRFRPFAMPTGTA